MQDIDKYIGKIHHADCLEFMKQLPDKCVAEYSKEGDLIADFFSGSGTTAIACHNLKRNFICVEKDKEYYAASVKRLEEHKRQMNLF